MVSSLVSVIIPTFKRKKDMVKRAVESVLQQSYQDFEIIVVDDSPSNFEGRDDIKNYLYGLNDNRIKLIQHTENRGANVARNTGIKHSEGEYISFLDDDDEWLPRKLESQLKKFTNSEVGLVYSSYYTVYNGSKIIRETKLEKGFIFKNLLYENFIGSTSSIMVKKDCINDVGMFDEDLQASQDYDLYLRIAKKYQIDFVEEPLIYYYEHEGERISGNPSKKLKARVHLYNKFRDDIIKYPMINSRKNLYLAYSYSEVGENRLKWKHWFKAVKIAPRLSVDILKSIKKVWFNM